MECTEMAPPRPFIVKFLLVPLIIHVPSSCIYILKRCRTINAIGTAEDLSSHINTRRYSTSAITTYLPRPVHNPSRLLAKGRQSKKITCLYFSEFSEFFLHENGFLKEIASSDKTYTRWLIYNINCICLQWSVFNQLQTHCYTGVNTIFNMKRSLQQLPLI